MANVIDRLRVQGNPAPRNLPSQPQSGLRRLGRGGEDGEAELPPDVQFLLNHSHLQNRETNSGRLLNQTARRLEHLQRVQHANQGLSSMDSRREPDLQGKQFLLRGKPASAEVALLNRHNSLQQQEIASSAGSGTSARRVVRYSKALSEGGEGVLSRARLDRRGSGKSSGAPDCIFSQPASAPHLSTATTYFVLASPSTVHNAATSGGLPPAKGRSDGSKLAGSGSGTRSVATGRRQANQMQSAGSATTFELTGHQVITPRSNTGYDDGFSSRDVSTRSPRHGRQALKECRSSVLKDRKSPGLKDASLDPAPVDTQSLRQCLHVQQSSQALPNPQELHTDPAVKLKHLTQYVRNDPLATRSEPKVNYNNPYRQTRVKERRALPESTRRYIFDSVASYIHFNKIYPQLQDPASRSPMRASSLKSAATVGGGGLGLGGGGGSGGGGGGLAINEGLPKVPHLAGFPSHCTDTILLRMMFEMNRPGMVHGVGLGLGHQAAGAPSVRSSISTKYSDIGRQRDLDEFLVQGEAPSTSHSQRQNHHQLSSSHRSVGNLSLHAIQSPPKEEDEEGRSRSRGATEEVRTVEEEDESTLRTERTPGRRPVVDEDGEDADDESSQWNMNGGARGGGGGGGGRKGGPVADTIVMMNGQQ